MRELKMKLCALMLPLVAAACASTPPAPQPCQPVKPPEPPAWIMQPAPDWEQPLSELISPSGSD
ncbi:Rz1 family lipoprotein [Escherichia coli]|nr:Rz1 family lipoprotein [Escherichia coli]